jgi:hypothetical protein
MTDRELMQRALEALQMGLVETFHARQENAITALRAAIEAAEKKEPVAWGMMDDHGEVYDCVSPRARARYVQHEGRYTVPLYTNPPAAQRLEAVNAQLLKALESVVEAIVPFRSEHAPDWWKSARAAIAAAKGEV